MSSLLTSRWLDICVAAVVVHGGALRLAAAEPAVITVRPQDILRVMDDSPLGVDVNYLRDAAGQRPAGSRPLGDALAELRVRWLRYPGGEKANAFFFGPPPFNRSAPVTFGAYTQFRRADLLDFDQYMALVRQLHAEPYVVAGYDTFARKGKTRAEYLAHAVGWVRYANLTHHYGVKYWEIGNENWNHKGLTAPDMAGVVTEFSRAMKAVDPSIKVGTNALNRAWAETLIQRAGADLDFISYSNYFNSDHGYDKYLQANSRDLILRGREIADVIEHSAQRGRVKVIDAEFGAVDFRHNLPLAERWEGNDLGHTLALFDMEGQFLTEPRIAAAMYWTTRWMDDMHPVRQCYALGAHNEILPTGLSLELWGRFIQREMVGADGLPHSPAYASFDPASGRLTVAIINKDDTPRTVSVAVDGIAAVDTAVTWHLLGSGPADRSPQWARFRGAAAAGPRVDNVSLAPYSITILDLTASRSSNETNQSK